MAEKVTLKKPDGTIIYPQTQVDTADIANGAVTAAKLASGVLADFTGTDGVSAGTAGLVPAPAAADANKFLNSDGSWTAVSAGSSTITGTGAPTSSTAAEVGQFYLDTQTGNTYVCTDDTGGTYTWDTVGGGVSLTMTTTDPGEGSALASNTILGVYDGGGVTMDYSIAEQATGYTWINGNMIYKKTFSFTTDASSVQTWVTHNISNLGVVVDIRGMVNSAANTWQPADRCVADNVSAYSISLGDIDSTRFLLLVGSSVAKGVQAYVTMWYTKS